MVKIIGDRKEIGLVQEMLESSDILASMFRTKDMKDNEVGIEGKYEGVDIEFIVEFKTI